MSLLKFVNRLEICFRCWGMTSRSWKYDGSIYLFTFLYSGNSIFQLQTYQFFYVNFEVTRLRMTSKEMRFYLDMNLIPTQLRSNGPVTCGMSRILSVEDPLECLKERLSNFNDRLCTLRLKKVTWTWVLFVIVTEPGIFKTKWWEVGLDNGL